QRRRRRDRARPSGRSERQPHRAASRQRDEAARGQAGHRHRMHWRRAGRRHVDRGGIDGERPDHPGAARSRAWAAFRGGAPGRGAVRHWRLARDEDAVAWLALDKAGTSANTLSEEVLAELDQVLAELEREPPKGLVLRSAKPAGFIAGADIGEFRGMTDVVAA